MHDTSIAQPRSRKVEPRSDFLGILEDIFAEINGDISKPDRRQLLNIIMRYIEGVLVKTVGNIRELNENQ